VLLTRYRVTQEEINIFGFSGDALSMRTGVLPRQVIQAAPKVVNYVTHTEANLLEDGLIVGN
jgi:hypothetical protein